jgi:hypothetical protein
MKREPRQTRRERKALHGRGPSGAAQFLSPIPHFLVDLLGLPVGSNIQVAVCPDPSNPRPCAAAGVLRELLAAGRLPRFAKVFGAPSPDGLGDCHEVAAALMADLVHARRAEGWVLCTAAVHPAWWPHVSEHCWLEHDGFAVDAANGKCVVTDATLYRAASMMNVVGAVSVRHPRAAATVGV